MSQVVGKVWLAACNRVYEVQLFDNHSCQLVLEPNNNIATSLVWGKTDDKYVFSMQKMPEGVDQLSLPIIVEGGFLTGNKKMADQMALMLGRVAIQATMAAYLYMGGSVQQMTQKLQAEVASLPSLPTPLESDEDEEEDKLPEPYERPDDRVDED